MKRIGWAVLAALGVALVGCAGVAAAVGLWVLLAGDDTSGPAAASGPWELFDAAIPRAQGGADLRFEPVDRVVIGRTYDHRVQVPLTNHGAGSASVRVHATGGAALAAGFVGVGSMDWHAEELVELGPGETWTFPLVVHTPTTPAGEHPITVQALVVEAGEWRAAAEAIVDLELRLDPLALDVRCLPSPTEVDRARLVQELTITNRGAAIADLSVALADRSANQALFSPVVAQDRLPEGQTLRVRVLPRLHPEFTGLDLGVVVSGNGEQRTVSCAASIPPGQRVFVVGARCTSAERAAGKRCTNRRHASYDLQPPRGTHTSGSGDPSRPPGPVSPPDRVTPPDRDGADTEDSGFEEYSSGFGYEITEEAERAVEANLDAATRGIRDAVPSEAFGGEERPSGSRGPPDGPLGLPPRAPGRDRLADPIANTAERVVRRDGDDLEGLVRRRTEAGVHLTYRPMSEGRRERYPARTVATGGEITSPRLAALPDGAPVAAYLRTEGGSTVVEVVAIHGDLTVRLGTPEVATTQPVLVPRADGLDVLYLEGGTVWRVALDGALTASPPEAVLAGVSPGATVRADRKPDGSLVVLARRNPLLLFEADAGRTTELPGISGDVRIDGADRPVVAVRGDDGSVSAWVSGVSTPLFGPGWASSNPVLVRTDDGLRLLVHRDFVDAPEAEAGGTWALDYRDGTWDPEPRRVQQPEAPVEAAWLALDFSLPWNSAHYKPMTTEVLVNGVRVGRLARRIPSGRYLFRVPVSALHLRSLSDPEPLPNKVDLNTTTIGGGNFHLVDRATLYARHAFVQDALVATSLAEAERLASLSSPELRHQTADVVLDANGWQAPRSARPGDRLTAVVGVTNTGDAALPSGKLVARAGAVVLGTATYPEVAGFSRTSVRVPVALPADWDVHTALPFTIEADGPHAPDRRDHVLEFGIFGTPVPGLAGPRTPTRLAANAPSEGEVKLAAGVAVPIGGPRARYRVPVAAEGDLVVEVVTPGGGTVAVTPVLFRGDGQRLVEAGNALLPGDAELTLLLEGAEGLPAGSTIAVDWR